MMYVLVKKSKGGATDASNLNIIKKIVALSSELPDQYDFFSHPYPQNLKTKLQIH
jgi:hypothetical protein